MNKRSIPVYQVTSEYSGCLEAAFGARQNSSPGTASEGGGFCAGVLEGAMGNTPLSVRHIGELSEDTVHLSVWASYGENKESLFSRLFRAQQDARGKAEQIEPTDDDPLSGDLDLDPALLNYLDNLETSEPGVYEGYLEAPGNNWFEFGGQGWRVKAHGIGGKDKRSYYPYAIQAGGVLLAFRRDKHETVSNMWIEMGSIPLAENGGLEGVWRVLGEMFRKEGIHIEKTIVSRVDIYADFDGVPVGDFCDRFENNCRITRARRLAVFGEELNYAQYFRGQRQTGFSIGTNIKLRCYDKALELRNDPIKWGVFASRYGNLPAVLTRVEFQLRRVALKEFLIEGCERIDGVESYLKAREQLWLYLTEDWFRLTEDEVDKKNRHQDRAKTWSVWERVQKAVVGVAKLVFRHPRAPKCDMEALYNQAIGCICGIAAYEMPSGQEITALDVMRHFWNKVRDHGERAFHEVMERHHERAFERLGFCMNL